MTLVGIYAYTSPAWGFHDRHSCQRTVPVLVAQRGGALREVSSAGYGRRRPISSSGRAVVGARVKSRVCGGIASRECIVTQERSAVLLSRKYVSRSRSLNMGRYIHWLGILLAEAETTQVNSIAAGVPSWSLTTCSTVEASGQLRHRRRLRPLAF